MARSLQRLVHMACHFHRHIQLKTLAAHIAHAGRTHAGKAHINKLGPRELQPLGAQVVGAYARHEFAGLGSHDREHGVQRRNVGQHGVFGGQYVARDPVEIAHRLRRTSDDQKAVARVVGRLPNHGQVALKTAALVEHGGVDHFVDGHIHFVGAQALQHGQCVAPLQQQFGE